MKITRNHLSLATSIIMLAAVMVTWPNLFLWSKIVHFPDWAEHLPAPVFTGTYISFVCLIPAALGADNFSSAKRALGRCEQVDRTFTTNSLSAFEMPITPKT
ncbi:hypothetical protein [Aeromonas veronii]|uniref:hypothetical protein n=1 Tax=Aeromonas veronii TaxID=654 RepID=UPI003D1B071E